MTPEALLRFNLDRANFHACQALDQIYGAHILGQTKRGFWWRRRLLRAQSDLMTLLVRESSGV